VPDAATRDDRRRPPVLSGEMADGQTNLVDNGRVNSGFGQPLDPFTLERARRGDMAAFAAIYQRFGSACYNLALRVLGEPAAAEDIVQEVFLKMFSTLRGFRGEAPFGAWLKRMTANATIDVLRAHQRFRDDDAETLFAALPAPLAEAEQRTDAWSLLMRLPPRARAIVILHEVEGYTHKELAELFGQSESYSKSILARALKRLNEDAQPLDSNEAWRHA
jgi:RNA polymerase sigma-70 factor (ECF subfamily)